MSEVRKRFTKASEFEEWLCDKVSIHPNDLAALCLGLDPDGMTEFRQVFAEDSFFNELLGHILVAAEVGEIEKHMERDEDWDRIEGKKPAIGEYQPVSCWNFQLRRASALLWARDKCPAWGAVRGINVASAFRQYLAETLVPSLLAWQEESHPDYEKWAKKRYWTDFQLVSLVSNRFVEPDDSPYPDTIPGRPTYTKSKPTEVLRERLHEALGNGELAGIHTSEISEQELKMLVPRINVEKSMKVGCWLIAPRDAVEFTVKHIDSINAEVAKEVDRLSQVMYVPEGKPRGSIGFVKLQIPEELRVLLSVDTQNEGEHSSVGATATALLNPTPGQSDCDPILADKANLVIQTLFQLGAVNPAKRVTTEFVAEKAEGKYAKADGMKRVVKGLKQRGLVDTKASSGGGVWLTQAGLELAKRWFGG